MTRRTPEEVDSMISRPSPEASAAPADGREELTRGSLSAEALRWREGCDLPVRLLPLPREGTRGALREHTLGLNRLIAREGGAAPSAAHPGAPFHPLWRREELAALGSLGEETLSAEWRRRIAAEPHWAPLAAALRPEQDFAAIWRSLAAGDFDLSGRGKDYTTGMEYFQAARAFGIEALLDLLRAADGGGLHLDVLGGDGYILRILQASRALRAGHPEPGGPPAPVMVTNDISPHMFRSAGLWGAPTRENADHLARTFRPASFDGVLFAYGTHHVAAIAAAIGQSFQVLRPGGRMVVHDFLDEGQVGRWFHEVVDRHSRTGHDFPHLGLVQPAVHAYLAGFRDVALHEMEDPFVFAVPEGSGRDARDIACTYLLGMYGMTASFGGQRDRFEAAVQELLTYPEIGNEPLFARDLVYVPRRAAVVSARRPAAPGAFTDADRALIRRLGELLAGDPAELVRRLELPPEVARAWFPDDGSRWGVSPGEQRTWLAWERSLAG